MIQYIAIGLAILVWLLGLKFWGEKLQPYSLTLRELIITVVCSFFPIILASVINSWLTPITLTEALLSSFEMGQAFLYTSAFLSAFFVFYIKGNDKPPGLILTCLMYSGLGGALLYTFAYSSQILNVKSYAPAGVIKFVELTIILSVVVVWYWSTLPSYKNASSGAKESQNQQSRLESKFTNLKGKE